MKPIRIYQHKVGLIFRKGNFIQMISEGLHWIRMGDKVQIFDRTQNFAAPCDLNILLESEGFRSDTMTLDVKDNEIALHYRDGNFCQVLGPGRHAFWKSVVHHEFKMVNLDDFEVTEEIDRDTIRRNRDLCGFCTAFSVDSFENGLLFADGQFCRKLPPGTYLFWTSRKNISVKKADLRQQQMEISGQEILTKDRAALRVNFYLHYQVEEIEKALMDNKEYEKQLYMIMQLALREYVGTQTLDELLANKEAVKSFIFDHMTDSVAELGCRLVTCGIRDVILPGEVKEIINQVLIAEKRAQANIITRRQETASTRSLLNTAKLMEDNEMLFRLKEMEYVEKIAEKINNISLSGGSQVVDQMREIFSK